MSIFHPGHTPFPSLNTANARPWPVASPRQTPLRVSDRALIAAVVLTIYMALAVLATWPLVRSLRTGILRGTEQVATVPIFDVWTLWWTADRATHGFARYWDAPFFYPNAGVFTYSEPQPLTGLLVAPLWGLGASPALVYNMALLGLLVLDGVCAYRLARALNVPRPPAILGGALVITLPYMAKEFGVLPLLALFGMFWTLEGLVRFGRSSALGHATWAAVGFVALYLTCEQYALMFAPFAFSAALLALAQQRVRPIAMLRLLATAFGAGVTVLLVAWPSLAIHHILGFSRSDLLVQLLSAQMGDFLTRPADAWISVPPPSVYDTAGLFPGFAIFTLAVLGIGELWWPAPTTSRPWIAYLAGSVIVAIFLTLGLNLDVLGWHPFATLRTFVPGFNELRSVFRFAAITQAMLAILATVALGRIYVFIQRVWRPQHISGVIILVLAPLMVLENLALPVPILGMPLSPRTAWTTWLRRQPANTVIAHVPFPSGLNVSDYATESWRLFAQIDHHKPMVNGYSSNFPPFYARFQLDMASNFPRLRLLCTLGERLGVTTLVADREWLVRHQTSMATFDTYLHTVYTDSQTHIYRLRLPNKRCAGT